MKIYSILFAATCVLAGLVAILAVDVFALDGAICETVSSACVKYCPF